MSFVDYQLTDHVAVLTITREEALNALNTEVLEALSAALDRAGRDQARCVVVTGAGRAFVAGADVSAMATMTTTQAREFSHLGNGAFRKLEMLPIPSIAAINGFALGGGFELALACDIRLASDRAVFAQPEVGLGVCPGFGGTLRLPRLVGQGIARELLFTGARLEAGQALAIGLVNAIFPEGKLMAAATELAGRIAAQAPIAVRATKTAIALETNANPDTAIAIEIEQFASCFETDDQREGMAAFLEKRPPQAFRDR